MCSEIVRAAGHGIACVHHEVDENLFKLPLESTFTGFRFTSWTTSSVTDSPTRRRKRWERSANTSDKSNTASCRVCCLENARSWRDEARGPVGVLVDLHDIREGLVARVMAQKQQIAETGHRRQEVVEVVRHAACQLADRLHLLRLQNLLSPTGTGGKCR